MTSIDVIVPCYRYGRYLKECINSILAQPGVAIRVLIIDDASPDGSADIAHELARDDSRIEVVRHTRNIGPTATFNEGIEWASADYMLIISADDYLLPGALERSVNLMDQHPEIGLTFGRVMRLRDGVMESKSKLAGIVLEIVGLAECRILTGTQFIERSGSINIVPAPAAVVRTSLQKRVGGYRAELPHAHDMEMWLRMSVHSSVGVIKAFQAVYRVHEGNISSAYYRNGGLADMRQRRAAFDCFFYRYGGMLPGARELRSKLLCALAGDAVIGALGTFNAGAFEASKELSDLAVDLCPSIKRSVPWAKLVCRRLVGHSLWQLLRGVRRVVVRH